MLQFTQEIVDPMLMPLIEYFKIIQKKATAYSSNNNKKITGLNRLSLSQPHMHCIKSGCHTHKLMRTRRLSPLSKNFNFSILSFLRLLGSSDILLLVLVTINFLSMTINIKKASYQHFSWPI